MSTEAEVLLTPEQEEYRKQVAELMATVTAEFLEEHREELIKRAEARFKLRKAILGQR